MTRSFVEPCQVRPFDARILTAMQAQNARSILDGPGRRIEAAFFDLAPGWPVQFATSH